MFYPLHNYIYKNVVSEVSKNLLGKLLYKRFIYKNVVTEVSENVWGKQITFELLAACPTIPGTGAGTGPGYVRVVAQSLTVLGIFVNR